MKEKDSTEDSTMKLLNYGTIGGGIAGGAIGTIFGPVGTLCGGLLGMVVGDEIVQRNYKISTDTSSWGTPSETSNSSTKQSSSNPFGSPDIAVVGCGGSGANTIHRLSKIGIEGAKTVAIDTDSQHLNKIDSDEKILIGEKLTNGLGAGGDPDLGRKAAEMAEDAITESLRDADLVFIVSGLGGGTGSGASTVVSQIAEEQGAITLGIVTMPFNVESARTDRAEVALNDLLKLNDSTIVLDNNKLLDYIPSLPITKSFSVLDQLIAESVKGITETLTQPALINLDYADLASVMNESGLGVLLIGENSDKSATEQVIEDTISHPLSDIDYQSASGGLVHITGGPDLSLEEAESIVSDLVGRLESPEKILWSANTQENYEGKVRVMALLTGAESREYLKPQSNNTDIHAELDDDDDVNVEQSNRTGEFLQISIEGAEDNDSIK